MTHRASQIMVQRLTSGGNIYSRCRRGRRADLGPTMWRSRWEANIARYLNWLVAHGQIIKWDYEKQTFWFENIKRGVRSYTPDFRVWEKGYPEPYYIEVKGWMDRKSKTKLKRMKKYYPTVRVDLLDEKRYRGIQKTVAPLIPTWEYKGDKTFIVPPITNVDRLNPHVVLEVESMTIAT